MNCCSWQVVPYEMYAGAMRLDGPTLGNLEVLTTPEGHPQGSLLARIDTCVYPGALCELSWLQSMCLDSPLAEVCQAFPAMMTTAEQAVLSDDQPCLADVLFGTVP